MSLQDPDTADALSDLELAALVRRVFAPDEGDKALAILVDLPDATLPDHPEWAWRRETAARWRDQLRRSDLGLEIGLWLYPNVHANNAELPAEGVLWGEGPLPADADALAASGVATTPFEQVFQSHSIVMAPTQLSATAPLKLAAKRHQFRAATLPGFNAAMIPALRLDYGEIDRRVRRLQGLLEAAAGAYLVFEVGGIRHELTLDLRHRPAHASSGLCTERGYAGNLPSGEAYMTPYEGERAGDTSRTRGVLPVELDGEVVLYQVEANKAVAVLSEGPISAREAALIAREPAYANIAELGLGVLADFGIEPIGQVLLDEKQGLHIAFGRSDHFGGVVGPKDFSSSEAVVHIDRVYLPTLQPRVAVPLVDLVAPGGERLPLMRDFVYVCGW